MKVPKLHYSMLVQLASANLGLKLDDTFAERKQYLKQEQLNSKAMMKQTHMVN